MHSFETPKSIEKKVMYSLKMIRKGKKLSQTDLAREMNVSRDTVARLESGRSRVTLAQVITIAQILGATLDKILSEAENNEYLELALDETGNETQTTTSYYWGDNNLYTLNMQSHTSSLALEGLPEKKITNPFLKMRAVETFGVQMRDFILDHKTLWWWVAESDLEQLSMSSIVEAILNYGSEQDVADLFKIVTVSKVSEIFKAGNQGIRSNYQSEVITYFESYFKRHVSGYSN
jgi:transcriptional regulator with XRE-family HTH domain